ncbi:hypothetical protein LF1_58260 [Rubripirellula obstinata]|uniref:Uncharacterized protein n=1 Tax=Rubripirellula obstinata TaxID=406547 RepID=A0A5B1CBH0_9BACT|nr:hypothetical protein LF1_58260 [Rubripirellula obstinata]
MVLGTACFFGWRNYNPERSAIIAIENASGRVHFKYQGPAMAPFPGQTQRIARFDDCPAGSCSTLRFDRVPAHGLLGIPHW